MIVKALIAATITFFGCPAFSEEIVIIGDSLSCGPFGKNLVKDLTAKSNRVTLYCAVSSTPENWLKGKNPPGRKCQILTSVSQHLTPCGSTGQIPKLDTILAAHHGARVVVGLGTNSLLSPFADNSYVSMAKEIAKSGAKCDWIGPPHLNPAQAKGFPKARIQKEDSNLNSFYDSLADAVQNKCSLIDSRDATAAGTPGNQTVDGVHRDESAGIDWAKFTTQKIFLPGEDGHVTRINELTR